jgi:FkbM family methyltransferase
MAMVLVRLRTLSYGARDLVSMCKILTANDLMKLVGCVCRNLGSIICENNVRPVDSCMTKDVLEVKVLGHWYSLLSPDFALVRELYGRRCYFLRRSWIPQRGHVVVDLGANAGLFTVLCAKRGARVIAVEAQGALCQLIEAHLRINNCREVVSMIQGLIKPEVGCFVELTDLERERLLGAETRVTTIEHVLELAQGQRIDLLKVDIEGSEFALFAGDLSWLRQVDKITMEVHPEYGSVETLVNRLGDYGYHCEIVASWREPTTTAIIQYPGYCYAYRRAAHA